MRRPYAGKRDDCQLPMSTRVIYGGLVMHKTLGAKRKTKLTASDLRRVVGGTNIMKTKHDTAKNAINNLR